MDVYLPAAIERPGFAVLFLHGIGGETLRDCGAFTTVFDELQIGCVSPHGDESWWTDRICHSFDERITAEQHLLRNVVPLFDGRWGITPPRIGVLGISMGGQGALRLGFKYPRLFPAVAGISSAIEYHELYGQGTPLDAMYDSKEQCRQDTAPMHIQPADYPRHIFFCIDPADWPWFRGNDRLHEKLSALGVAHEYDFATSVATSHRSNGETDLASEHSNLDGAAHSWVYFNHMAERSIRSLYQGMVAESRRLL